MLKSEGFLAGNANPRGRRISSMPHFFVLSTEEGVYLSYILFVKRLNDFLW